MKINKKPLVKDNNGNIKRMLKNKLIDKLINEWKTQYSYGMGKQNNLKHNFIIVTR